MNCLLLQAAPDALTNGWKKPAPESQPKSPSSPSKPAPKDPQQTPLPKTASSSSSPDRQKSTPTPSKASATPDSGKAAASSDKAEHRPGPIAYSSALADSSPSSIRTTAAKEHTSAGQNFVSCLCMRHCPTHTCCMAQIGLFDLPTLPFSQSAHCLHKGAAVQVFGCHSGFYTAGTPKAAGPSPNTPAGASSRGQASDASPSPKSGKAVNIDEEGWETVVGKKPAKSNKRQQSNKGYQGRR